MEEKLSQHIPSWFGLMVYWPCLCHMPRLLYQSLDKRNGIAVTVLDHWSSILAAPLEWSDGAYKTQSCLGSPLWTRVLSPCPITWGLDSEKLLSFQKVRQSLKLWNWLCDTQGGIYSHSLDNSSLSVCNRTETAQIDRDVIPINTQPELTELYILVKGDKRINRFLQ